MKSLRFSKLCARVSSSLLAFGPKTQLTISRNFITKEFVLHSDYPGMYVEGIFTESHHIEDISWKNYCVD